MSLTRRDALKRLGRAGAGLAAVRGVLRRQSSELVVAGKPVEIVVSTMSRFTVRISVLPIEGGAADHLHGGGRRRARG